MKTTRILFWLATILFALEMAFTAYAQLRLPVVAAAFARMGFPGYFRVELAIAKFFGLAALLIPAIPARLKEWAYCSFFIVLVSALIAHFAIGEGPQAWGYAAFTLVLWAVSYTCWRRLTPASFSLPADLQSAPAAPAPAHLSHGMSHS